MANIVKLPGVCGEISQKAPTNRITYSFKSSQRNTSYQGGNPVPLRACPIHNKSSKNGSESRNPPGIFVSSKVIREYVIPELLDSCPIQTTRRVVNGGLMYMVQTAPQYLVELNKCETDSATGQETLSIVLTDDLKASKSRMVKGVKRFSDYYEPLYHNHKVSIFFFTLTRINYSSKTIDIMLECTKSRLKALNWPLRGYIWVLEAKYNPKMEGGYHLHYHLVIATDRVRITRIPNALKMDTLWGQITNVGFIKKSVRGYLSKYLLKTDARVCGKRRYGVSKKFL